MPTPPRISLAQRPSRGAGGDGAITDDQDEQRRKQDLALDEEVGKLVFGLVCIDIPYRDGTDRSERTWVKYGLRDDGGYIYASSALEIQVNHAVRLWGPDVHWNSLPCFSQSPAAAWLIFIWLTERYGGVSIQSDMEEFDAGAPVTVYVPNAGVRVLWEPLPRALCHAALAAVKSDA